MNRRPLISVLLMLVIVCASFGMRAIAANSDSSETAIPRVLDDWRAWVLRDQGFRRCPFLAGEDASSEGSHRCAWPGRLHLTIDAHGGRFIQQWQVYNDSWIALPGELEHW